MIIQTRATVLLSLTSSIILAQNIMSKVCEQSRVHNIYCHILQNKQDIMHVLIG